MSRFKISITNTIENLLNFNLYLIAPIFFGLWSLFLGQDRSFDLANYHLYNGFSFLNNKLLIDLAPAGVQSYLNPLLDSFYYYLNKHLNVYFFGFLMGAIHSINFIFLYKIVNIVLPRKDIFLNIILALGGILSCNFLGGLGNSMGDNSTSIFILASLFLLLKNWQSINRLNKKNYLQISFAGFLIGVAISLKLTNTVFVLGSLSAFVFLPTTSPLNRWRYFFIYLIGIFIAFIIFAGWWHWQLWVLFKNPIFPFFSNFFPGSLSGFVNPTSTWSPDGLFENLFWPYIFSLDYTRVSEGHFHQILWPVFYTISLLFLFKHFQNSFIQVKNDSLNKTKEARMTLFLVCFALISIFVWMRVFNVIRYIVALELLIPSIIFLMLLRLTSYKRSKRFIVIFSTFSIFLTLLGGYGTWGHSSWEKNPFYVEMPGDINLISNATVVIAGGAPITWMATEFPISTSFVKFNVFNDQVVRKKIADNNRPVYAMFGGFYNWRSDNVAKWNDVVDFLGMLDSENDCKNLSGFIQKVHFRGKVKFHSKISKNVCFLTLKDEDYIEPKSANMNFIYEAKKELALQKLDLDETSCSLHSAKIGSQGWAYNWCRINNTKSKNNE